MAAEDFNHFRFEYGNRCFLPEEDPRVQQVKRVGERILRVSGLRDQGRWEFFVIDSTKMDMNAVTIPGKVFVSASLLVLAPNDDCLAAVLSHEVAHGLARHAAEYMSVARPVAIIIRLIAHTISRDLGRDLGRIFKNYYETPFLKRTESEADYIGLMLMAQACYNPVEALTMHRLMVNGAKTADTSPRDFGGDSHPSNETRIEQFKQWMPEALKKRAVCCLPK